MSTAIKRRRGTTVQHSTFIGQLGEWTWDTDLKTIVGHDGVRAGGYRQNLSFNVWAFGADGTGVLDSGAAFTAAIARANAEGGGTVYVPKGAYKVAGTTGNQIKLKSRVTLYFEPGCTISSGTLGGTSQIITIDTADESQMQYVRILGNGVVITGDRDSAVINYGIALNCQASGDTLRKVYISDVELKNFRTDGFSVSGNVGLFPEDILIERMTCDNCYRNGASVIQVKRITFRDCVFKNTNGASPQCGVDVEPDTGLYIYDVVFDNCRFHDNTSHGLYVPSSAAPRVFRLRVIGCKSYDNGGYGYAISNGVNVLMNFCRAYGNTEIGISVQYQTEAAVTNCFSYDNGGNGVAFIAVNGGLMNNVSSFDNAGSGFGLSTAVAWTNAVTLTGCRASGNTLRGFAITAAHDIFLVGCQSILNGQEGVQLYEAQGCGVKDCLVAENSQTTDLGTDNILLEHNSNFNHIQGNTVRQSRRFFSGTAGAGSTTTATLPATAHVTDDDFYKGMTLRVISGTAANESGVISGYVASTRVATFPVVGTALDNSSVVQIGPANRPRYGIRVNSGCTGNKVTDNDAYLSGGTGSVSDAGASTVTTSANRT